MYFCYMVESFEIPPNCLPPRKSPTMVHPTSVVGESGPNNMSKDKEVIGRDSIAATATKCLSQK